MLTALDASDLTAGDAEHAGSQMWLRSGLSDSDSAEREYRGKRDRR
jgi:hypothetical protein